MAKQIMVVEDNDLNRKLFCDVLKSQGFTVEPVGDGLEALDKARARNDLEGACYSARSTLSKHASDVDVSAAQSEVDNALKWLNENNGADADAVRKRQQAFDAIVHPVIASCYEAHKQEGDDATDDPSDDKFFDGDTK